MRVNSISHRWEWLQISSFLENITGCEAGWGRDPGGPGGPGFKGRRLSVGFLLLPHRPAASVSPAETHTSPHMSQRHKVCCWETPGSIEERWTFRRRSDLQRIFWLCLQEALFEIVLLRWWSTHAETLIYVHEETWRTSTRVQMFLWGFLWESWTSLIQHTTGWSLWGLGEIVRDNDGSGRVWGK